MDVYIMKTVRCFQFVYLRDALAPRQSVDIRHCWISYLSAPFYETPILKRDTYAKRSSQRKSVPTRGKRADNRTAHEKILTAYTKSDKLLCEGMHQYET